MLELRGISRSYGCVVACDAVDLRVRPGAIHGVLGANGSGKSTLARLICGLARPDSGTIWWRGERVVMRGPSGARARGIAALLQPGLFDALSVGENLALRATTDWRAVARQHDIEVDETAAVRDLLPEARQRLALLASLAERPSLLIIDEPRHPETLAPRLAAIVAQGSAVLWLDHRADLLRALCDDITRLEGGRVVPPGPDDAEAPEPARRVIGPPVLQVRRTGARRGGGPRLSFELREGEILGLEAVDAADRSSMAAFLSGETLAGRRDQVLLLGEPVGRDPVRARRRAGLRLVPALRLDRAAIAGMSLSENALLTTWDKGLIRRGFIRHDKLDRLARSVIDLFAASGVAIDDPARQLTRGNLARFILGRELAFAPRVLVAECPTMGIDRTAIRAIHAAFLDIAAAGMAVLVLSDDPAELAGLCDRVIPSAAAE